MNMDVYSFLVQYLNCFSHSALAKSTVCTPLDNFSLIIVQIRLSSLQIFKRHVPPNTPNLVESLTVYNLPIVPTIGRISPLTSLTQAQCDQQCKTTAERRVKLLIFMEVVLW